MKQSATTRFVGSLALALLLATVGVQAAQAQPTRTQLPPDLGLWVEDGQMFLLTNALACDWTAEDTAQLLVSTDGGHTWKRRGPRLPGYAFMFLYVKDGQAWMAGEHTAEGPGSDPFVLIPSATGVAWRMQTIYEENAELSRMTMGSDGELTAWIQHLHESINDGWVGPVYVHRSREGGHTWKELGLARKQKVDGGTEFKRLSALKNPLWRTISYQANGFRLQHRETTDAPWKTVSRFPPLKCKN